MSKPRTRNIKVYYTSQPETLGERPYFAWDKHTDEYSWEATAAEARKVVEERNAGIRGSCKLGDLGSFIKRLTKLT